MVTESDVESGPHWGPRGELGGTPTGIRAPMTLTLKPYSPGKAYLVLAHSSQPYRFSPGAVAVSTPS